MLLLTRKVGQKIRIGEAIKITVAKVRGVYATLWIEAPKFGPQVRLRVGCQFMPDDQIVVMVTEIARRSVKIGIDAPPDVAVHREEIWQRIRDEQRACSLATSNNPQISGPHCHHPRQHCCK